MPKIMTDELFDMIARHEGFSATVYRCPAGYLTVGYGHNLEEPMTEKVARAILKEDTAAHIRELLGIFPKFYLFTRFQQMALIDMHFNLGHTRFRRFRRMIEAINAGDWCSARNEAADSQWYMQVGSRAREIVELMS